MLYVVDSVTRKWLEQAKLQGQVVGSSASDGTYAAGVNRVTELMPVLMNDIMSTAPEEQKVSSFLGSLSCVLVCARWVVSLLACMRSHSLEASIDYSPAMYLPNIPLILKLTRSQICRIKSRNC